MSELAVEVKVPSIGVNDNNATVVDIVVNEGEYINQGDLIAVLETTKSSFEVESPASGYLALLFNEGDYVKMNKVFCLVVPDESQLQDSKKAHLNKVSNNKTSINITKKAENLAKDHNIDIEELFKDITGIIREKDVEFFVEKTKNHIDEADILLTGKLNKNFIDSILADYENFSLLSSEQKVEDYRTNGADIGEGVKIGKGSVVVAEYLELKDDSSIGDDCYIRTKSFSMGKMSIIGNKANFVVNNVTIGDVCTFGFNIVVSGGFSLRSSLKIGDCTLVSANCLLDAGEGIKIGSNVGISPFVKLYTHNHWQSELEGYHSNFGPIVVDDNAYITGDSLIVPGVTIGKGSTVLANSTVIDNVKENTQVCGNPARLIGRIPGGLTIDKKERIVLRMISDMKELFREREINDVIIYLPHYVADSGLKDKIVITLSTPYDFNVDSIECILFDMEKLYIYGVQNHISDEVRNFLRKRGVKFSPIYWRYTGEKHLYND